MRKWALGAVATYGMTLAVLLQQVNMVVQAPYMDELFHIPQTQTYCAGQFDEWDPKITTFPGLYLVSMLYAAILRVTGLQHPETACSVSVLRSINVIFAIGNFFLFISLRGRLVPSDKHPLVHALSIAVFPFHFFFALLFYTDCGALFFVLLMYEMSERVNVLVYPWHASSFVPSALSGAIAVLFRQTNIIWVAFITGIVIVRCVETSHGNFIYGLNKNEVKLGESLIIRNRFRRVLLNFIIVIFTNAASLLQLVWPFISVMVGFIIFVVHNGGIVVGDKSNHTPSFHAAQLLYCVFICASGFSVSVFAPSQIQGFARSIRVNFRSTHGLLTMFSIASSVFLAIRYGSAIHPFMLDDNRHYTFYVWQRFFRKHEAVKYLPTCLYFFFGWRCWTELRRSRSPLWAVVFAIAVSLVLIPSPLVEPRYFLVPYTIFHLNTGRQHPVQVAGTIALYLFVNAVTIYVFLYKPYTWVDGSTGRFMW